MSTNSELLNETMNMFLNIMLFSLIPFIWYLIKNRKLKGFFESVGIFKAKNIKVLEILKILLPIYLITLTANIIVIESGNSLRESGGYENLPLIILFSHILLYGLKTGIAEEIFFRGFIAKKCFLALGFKQGNIVQAVIFALPHFVINGSASYIDITVRIINAFMLGYAFGYVLEKKSNGSILPVMIAHILINMVSSFTLLLII